MVHTRYQGGSRSGRGRVGEGGRTRGGCQALGKGASLTCTRLHTLPTPAPCACASGGMGIGGGSVTKSASLATADGYTLEASRRRGRGVRGCAHACTLHTHTVTHTWPGAVHTCALCIWGTSALTHCKQHVSTTLALTCRATPAPRSPAISR